MRLFDRRSNLGRGLAGGCCLLDDGPALAGGDILWRRFIRSYGNGADFLNDWFAYADSCTGCVDGSFFRFIAEEQISPPSRRLDCM